MTSTNSARAATLNARIDPLTIQQLKVIAAIVNSTIQDITQLAIDSYIDEQRMKDVRIRNALSALE